VKEVLLGVRKRKSGNGGVPFCIGAFMLQKANG
jgi:hypothetical protein